MWEALEQVPGLVAVDHVWRSWLAADSDAVKGRYLQRAETTAKVYPCPHECGCSHRIVEHSSDDIVAVCQCVDSDCMDIRLARQDIVLWELNVRMLSRAIARALGLSEKFRPSSDADSTWQISDFGGEGLPILLTIQHDADQFGIALGFLSSRCRRPFILLAPTNRFMDANLQAHLTASQSGFFALASHLTIHPNGELTSNRSAGELFSRFLSSQNTPADQADVVGLFKLLKVLSEERAWRKAPVMTVFRLYVVEMLSRVEIARRCKCSRGLISLRLDAMEARLGRPLKELRSLSSQFEEMEASLADPRARRIDRRIAGELNSPAGED